MRCVSQALSAGGLHAKFASRRFGLFTQLYLNDSQVSSLEKDHACYVAPGGRINVSSLTEAAAFKVATAVVAVCK
jgi:aspartate/tyrosine/aromatic aminotransferase